MKIRKRISIILKSRFCPAVLCSVFSCILAVIMIYPGHNWGGDFSQYIAQARALVQGNVDVWYEKNLFIINNSCDGLGSTVYPWGLPLLLTPLYALFGENVFVFKLLEIGLWTGSVFMASLFFENRVSKPAAIILTLLMGSNPVYLTSTDSVSSDIPCMFFSILAVYFIELHLQSLRPRRLNGILSGFFIFCAVQTRTMAFALLLALICVDMMILVAYVFKRYNAAERFLEKYSPVEWSCHLIPYGVFILGNLVINKFLPKAGKSYLDYFSISYRNIKLMLGNYYHCFKDFFGLFFVVFLILGIIGMLGYIFSEIYLVTYVAGTFFMLLIYQYYQGPRFLFSVFPFLFLFSCYGIRVIHKLMPYRAIYCMATLAAVIVMVLYGKQIIMEEIPVRRGISDPIDAYSEDAEAVYAYINQNISDDSIICFFKPRVLFLKTNVYSYTQGDDVDSLAPADYLLFWCNDFQNSMKGYISDKESYQLIYQNDQFMLYQCN